MKNMTSLIENKKNRNYTLPKWTKKSMCMKIFFCMVRNVVLSG